MRLPLTSLIVLAGLIGVVVLYEKTPPTPQTATGLDALSRTASVSLPQFVTWSGYISRVFVSGEGLEIVSSASSEGVFQAYMPIGQISPITDGEVVIQGVWNGFTCAYGGHQGRCIPEVDIQSITHK
jgi:hypothetical protein